MLPKPPSVVNRNECNQSQMSRENIHMNTKTIQNEIKDVDYEIAMLQGSLLQ